MAAATLASAAAVASAATAESLLDFEAKTEASCDFAAEEPLEMRDGISRARGARGELLGARGTGANRADIIDADDDADGEEDDDDDDARPPQEAAAAARAAIVSLLRRRAEGLFCCAGPFPARAGRSLPHAKERKR